MKDEILLYNRKNGTIEKEVVAGRLFMDFMYKTKTGKFLTDKIFKKRLFSVLYGNTLKKKYSRKKIESFIKKFNINEDEILDPVSSFKNFNEFFIRKLKPSARPIDNDIDSFISPADSRLSFYNIKENTIIPVKGINFTLNELLMDESLSHKYKNGICLVFRLAPVDYHRFCYVDDGQHGKVKKIGNFFHSVNPIALESNKPVFQGNYREYCELETKNFGNILYMEVGALGVSKIIQNHPDGCEFKRGEEKGYFEFGGSTTILILQPGFVNIDDDIVRHSEKGIETIVLYGSKIGKKI